MIVSRPALIRKPTGRHKTEGDIMSIRKVAFIGAGNMGSRMARRVMAAGHPVMVCDQDTAVLKRFHAEGAVVSQHAADSACADLIIVLVANDDQLRAVCTGENGIQAGLDGTRHPLVCVMSTVLPESVVAIGAALRPQGARVMDAPVSGGPIGAERGTLAIMLGGDQADMDVAMPVLRHLGENIFRCGDLGAGEVVKIVNNMLGVANIYLAGEAYALAERYGVAPESLAPILDAGTGRNFMSRDVGTMRDQYRCWGESEEAFTALLRIVRKDLQLAHRLAGAMGMTLPMLEGVTGGLDRVPDDFYRRWQALGVEPAAIAA
jgi:3-hydroxyisobutyrate dehydrogenase-like beta-hydroxyacid dehydrogenase